MHDATERLLRDYYAAFNRQDMPHFLDLLSDDVVHDVNEGSRESGKAAFAAFMERMNEHYREEISDLVIMTDAEGGRAAAEFVCSGEYLKSDEGLPPADGQTYRLRAGAFFEIEDGRITRVTNHYNLQDWIAQVGG